MTSTAVAESKRPGFESVRPFVTIDGNEAAAHVAYRLNEVIAIYPITPASPMGELCDAWASAGRVNSFGTVPSVMSMQSEAGAAGTVHGSLQAGALTTTFTASQGLLLMIPNMYKIAGELTPAVFHVSARALATHALSIFGDHSDVMSIRGTGWAMLASNSVQEAHDLALISHATTLESRVPFVHFFDGFRTSHEVNKIEQLTDDDIRGMVDDDWITAHRERAMDPDRPVLRGSAQNPDVFFQAREAANPFYDDLPAMVQAAMDRFAERVGRQYRLFDYEGDPEADRVVVLMGSGAGAAEEAVHRLRADGEKVGVLKVRLYRPFHAAAFLGALPKSARRVAVLDRLKEPGSLGEPLYLDVVAAMGEAGLLDGSRQVIGGRYGLSSKEFTPAMAARIFEELRAAEPKPRFTVGIVDDVTNLSLRWDPEFTTEADDVTRAVFYGLGSDGTVGASKNSVKIIGEHTPMYAQGYFVYDSKKSGSQTVSHLRFSPRPIHSTYLIDRANFVACHQFTFLDRTDVLEVAETGATFLLNAPYPADEVWDRLPKEVQQTIIDKQLRFYVVDAYEVARESGMGNRINTVMQTCFFHLAGVLESDEAIGYIKKAIEKTYGRRGESVLRKNFAAVDAALDGLTEVTVPGQATSSFNRESYAAEGSDFVSRVTSMLLAGRGELLPVSAMPVDGTFPTGTAKIEKRSIAHEVPIWDPEICIACGLCALVCPHTAIRSKAYPADATSGKPEGFQTKPMKGKDFVDHLLTIQVAPDDCTGCGVCVDVCPAKSKESVKHKAIDMLPKDDHLEREQENFDYFLNLPELDRRELKTQTVKGSQLLQPLFEFSGACAGCGETPYLKLLSQLYGDRAMIANATGCSSIYGGNLPTTPWTTDAAGRGPTWSNSLFEDAAEFGLGFRLAQDQKRFYAEYLLQRLAGELGDDLVGETLHAEQVTEADVQAQRVRVEELTQRLKRSSSADAASLLEVVGALVRKSVWIVGGDGWAYDIGFSGLDHALTTGRDINILVLDTGVYSNTGGQASKSTPRSAVAKFASAGKSVRRKDLGMLAVSYGNTYVAQLAMGANPAQTVRVFEEAESFHGPSLILAYSHCIAHGIDMTTAMTHQKEAVQSGFWPLYHYDPRLAHAGEHPFRLDSRKPSLPFEKFAMKEGRFAVLARSDPDQADHLFELAQADIEDQWHYYEQMAGIEREINGEPPEGHE
ncbi:MAG: pyruvate:ferredoxin (flavodoxin) oxidoreductase [Planctomycetota bacterium]